MVEQTKVKYTDEFQKFWAEYPKDADKKDAFAKWNKLGLEEDEGLRYTIVQDVKRRRKEHGQWRTPQFVPSAARYLGKEQWNNDIVPAKTERAERTHEADVPKPEIDPLVSDEQILSRLMGTQALRHIACDLKTTVKRVKKVRDENNREIILHRAGRGDTATMIWYTLYDDILKYPKLVDWLKENTDGRHE